MKADLIGRGGETYWLDMGAPVRLMTLVERLQSLLEHAGAKSLRVRVVGLRPGEKLHEELTTHGLELCRTAHRRIWSARQPALDDRQVRRVLRALRDDVECNDALSALSDLSAALPGFQPCQEAWSAAAAAAPRDARSVRAYSSGYPATIPATA
jgi:FlaA1/EpsC-like NDP-sugar epimerase